MFAGWFNFAQCYDSIIYRLRHRSDAVLRILEIGCFDGASTAHMAKTIQGLNDHRFEFHVCDLFLQHEQYVHEGLNEGDSFQHIFENNLRERGLIDRVHVHQGRSHDVLASFPDKYFDAVFIDGDHSFDGVYGDILGALRKLKPRGILAGHDYGLTSVRAALQKLGLRHTHDHRGDTWEVTGGIGVAYVSWGDKHVAETARSAQTSPYPTCLITDVGSAVPLGVFTHVVRTDFAEYDGYHHFYRKLAVLDLSPFDVTLYLDGDTYVQGDMSLCFEKALRFGFAATLAPGQVFTWHDPWGILREYVHFQGGLLCFARQAETRAWKEQVLKHAKTFTHTDEPAWSMAWAELGINPAVMPESYNCVRAGAILPVPIKMLHTRLEPEPGDPTFLYC